jgi:hypothetical protein
MCALMQAGLPDGVLRSVGPVIFSFVSYEANISARGHVHSAEEVMDRDGPLTLSRMHGRTTSAAHGGRILLTTERELGHRFAHSHGTSTESADSITSLRATGPCPPPSATHTLKTFQSLRE